MSFLSDIVEQITFIQKGVAPLNSDELRRLKDKGPYEHIMDGNFAMYDNVTYQRDISLCGPESLTLQSGNIIKYYRCKIIEVFNIISDKAIS